MFNSLGYYGPAKALLIRGTSRYHPGSTVQLKPAAGMAAAPARPGNGALAANGGKDPKPAVAAAPAGDGRPSAIPRLAGQNVALAGDKDPKKMWQQVIAGTIDDPGMIVAASEFLMDYHEPGHAAEVLKANLRKGLATDAWAHEALAVALQLGQASADEIERAATSAIDLDPASGKAYLRAAKAESELKNLDRALSFCRRAAELSPDLPGAYANALAYAERSDAVKADVVGWAAENLIRRDWPADGIDYSREAKTRLETIARKLEAAGRPAEAVPLRKALTEQTERELVIELRWEGAADLDLAVTEPSGAVCDATHKRSTGGGVLKADALEQTDTADANGNGGHSEEYTAAKAFNGTYKVSVKRIHGRPVGTAKIVVTKFKGTPKQVMDLIEVPAGSSLPVEVTLDGGTRSELATVPPDEDEFRLNTTGASSRVAGGMGAGFGASNVATVAPMLPVVNEAQEARVASGGGTAADLRAARKVNPDRRSVRISVNPVFGGMGVSAVAMPRVPLVPGGDGR